MAGKKGRSGAKPKPTAELERLGSWRAKNRKGEPARIDAELECPGWLESTAKLYWDAHYPMLYRSGVISAAEGAAFAMLCQRYADWWDAHEQCRERGRDLPVKDSKGRVIGAKRAPWDMRERDLFNQYVQLCREFGLTPCSRTGVRALEGETDNIEERIT